MSLFGNVMCLLYDKLYAFLDASDVLWCSKMSCIDTEYIYISCSTADLMGIMNDRTHI